MEFPLVQAAKVPNLSQRRQILPRRPRSRWNLWVFSPKNPGFLHGAWMNGGKELSCAFQGHSKRLMWDSKSKSGNSHCFLDGFAASTALWEDPISWNAGMRCWVGSMWDRYWRAGEGRWMRLWSNRKSGNGFPLPEGNFLNLGIPTGFNFRIFLFPPTSPFHLK